MDDITNGDVFAYFWLRLPGPGRQRNEPFFTLKLFLQTQAIMIEHAKFVSVRLLLV